jgi:hypothetical protein
LIADDRAIAGLAAMALRAGHSFPRRTLREVLGAHELGLGLQRALCV